MGSLAFDLCDIEPDDDYSPFDSEGNVIELGDPPFSNSNVITIESYLDSQKAEILYFIKVASDLVKIGSASNVLNFQKRLSECSRWVETPTVLGIAFCDRRVERLIHSYCHDCHVKTKGREIFRLEHDLKKSISLWCEWSIYGSKFGNTKYAECQCELEDFLQNPFKFYCELEGIDEDDLIEDIDDQGNLTLTLR
jgi:hypothetical protein